MVRLSRSTAQEVVLVCALALLASVVGLRKGLCANIPETEILPAREESVRFQQPYERFAAFQEEYEVPFWPAADPPGPKHVAPAGELERKRVKLGTVSHNSWIIEVGRDVEFAVPQVAEGAALRFSYALEEAGTGPLNFRVRLVAPNGEKTLLSANIQQSKEPRWAFAEAKLSPADLPAKLILSVKNMGDERANLAVSDIRLVTADEAADHSAIIYLIDTLRSDHLGCYGYEKPTSPHIDTFAEGAFLFSQARATSTWTKPSTATVLTGLPPDYHGANHSWSSLRSECVTLAEMFKAAGYTTVAFVTNGWVGGSYYNFWQGFDEFDSVEPREGIDYARNKIRAEAVQASIEKWLEKHSDERFFMYVHTIDPHAPYVPPEEDLRPFEQSYDGKVSGKIYDDEGNPAPDSFSVIGTPADVAHVVALYDGEVHYSDRWFGELVRELKDRKMYDKTMVLLVADHGEKFWEEGHDPPRWDHGHTLYDVEMRVPLVVRAAWMASRAGRSDAVVTTADITPTVAEMFGLECPPCVVGKSLLPLIKGEAGSNIHGRQVFACETRYGGGRFDMLYGVLAGGFKYVRRLMPEPKEYLFDLQKDPEERRNVLEEIPEAGAKLKGAVEARFMAADFSLRLSSDAVRRSMRAILVTDGSFERIEAYPAFARRPQTQLTASRQKIELSGQMDVTDIGVDFSLSPPDASIMLDVFAEGQQLQPGRVYLGALCRSPTSLPLRVQGASEALAANPEATSGILIGWGTGCFLWRLETDLSIEEPQGTQATPPLVKAAPRRLDKETLDRLRALGYVK